MKDELGATMLPLPNNHITMLSPKDRQTFISEEAPVLHAAGVIQLEQIAFGVSEISTAHTPILNGLRFA